MNFCRLWKLVVCLVPYVRIETILNPSYCLNEVGVFMLTVYIQCSVPIYTGEQRHENEPQILWPASRSFKCENRQELHHWNISYLRERTFSCVPEIWDRESECACKTRRCQRTYVNENESTEKNCEKAVKLGLARTSNPLLQWSKLQLQLN